MNRLFTAWVENVYPRRVHNETGMAPLARWMAGAPFPVPSPGDLADAFRRAEWRTVAKTGLVSLRGTATRSTRHQSTCQVVVGLLSGGRCHRGGRCCREGRGRR